MHLLRRQDRGVLVLLVARIRMLVGGEMTRVTRHWDVEDLADDAFHAFGVGFLGEYCCLYWVSFDLRIGR